MIIIGLACLLTLYGIYNFPIIDGDTAFYAKIARNIIESNNWLQLRYIHATDLIVKPPLSFWLMAASMKIFGITNFAINIWQVFFSLGLIAVFFKLGKELFDERKAFYSSLVLLTSAQFFYQMRIPQQDIMLIFFITTAIFLFAKLLNTNKTKYLYLCSLVTALSVLTKGPLGLIIIGSTIFLWLLFNKQLSSFLKNYWKHVIIALILFLIVASSWYVIQVIINGTGYLENLYYRNIARYFKPIDGNTLEVQRNWWVHPLALLATSLPWGGFLYPGLIYLLINKKTVKGALPILCWFIFILIFFSISGDRKIIRYLLPLFPALALIIGNLWADCLAGIKKTKKYMFTGMIISFFLSIPVLGYIVLQELSEHATAAGYLPLFIPFILLLFGGIIISILLYAVKQPKKSYLVLILFSLSGYLYLISMVNLQFKNFQPYQPFAEYINKFSEDNSLIYERCSVGEHFLNFYINKKVSPLSNDNFKQIFATSTVPIYVITDITQEKDLKTINNVKIIKKQYNVFLLTNNEIK